MRGRCFALATAFAASTAVASDPPPGERIPLTGASLFIPRAFQPIEGRFELTLHLHGAAGVTETNFVRSRQPGVLVNVTLPGLSAVYSRHFADPGVFTRLLDEVRAGVERHAGAEGLKLDRITVSSFSAGFGGVRELLKDAAAFARIDVLVMADSIYAGFTGDPALRQIDPANMEGFLTFARAAAAGRKTMLVTHTRLHTPTYASTAETADYVIREMGGVREAAAERWPGDMLLESRFHRGRLAIYGFAGDTGEKHMKHLRFLSTLLEKTRSLGLPRVENQ